jgi:hypothetical protein
MNKQKTLTLLIWGTAGGIMLLFLAWHGAFNRPLSDAEITAYMATMLEQGFSSEFDYDQMTPNEIRDYLLNQAEEKPEQAEGITRTLEILTFMQEDDGQPIMMVNLLDLRETPNDVDGQSFGGTSEEALGGYSGFLFGYLLSRGSYPVYDGDAAIGVMESWGVEGVDDWSSAGMVRYRSRRVLMDMAINPEFHQSHDGKVAALEKTISVPTGPNLFMGNLSVIVGLGLLSGSLGMQLIVNKRSDNSDNLSLNSR